MKKLITRLPQLLTPPGTFDADDLRRRKILNSIILVLIVLSATHAMSMSWGENVASISATMLCCILIVLNRSKRVPRNFVGWVLVMGMTLVFAVSDTPSALTSGRSIYVWAIPTTLSVIVLPPASVFIVDLVITLVFAYFSNFQWNYFQTYTLVEIYLVSFMSWLGMSIAEQAIRDAHNESRKNTAILEGVAEGVIVLGPNNRLALANRAASELLGSEISGISPTTESAEVQGRSLSFHWSRVEGIGWVAIVRDISRQIEIDHARDAILRVVSHEMRTPLASILGFAEILETRSVPGMATRIRVNAHRLLKLVNDLLDVAQLQAGTIMVHPENFSPSVLSAYVRENFLKMASEKDVSLQVHVSPDLPEQVIGDVQRLEQVLSNLVENAIKFTEKGGCVDVSFCGGYGTWQVVVKDSGIGIPPERLADIFEPFRRASDYARRKHQGVGLGLSIAQRIVQLSKGTITVESQVGKGSTFKVTLPVSYIQ